jgi:hypothetical protein
MPKSSPAEDDEAHAPKSSSAFSHVCKIEHPLGAIKHLADAVALITETMEEPRASAINEIVWTMKDHFSELDKIYEVFPTSPSQSRSI